ncbi:MAG: hypothetical protein ACLUGJ_02905 [Blautia wexlerae]
MSDGEEKGCKVLSSYGVELRKQNIPIHQTLEIYRSAVSYLTEIYGQVWEELEQISDSKRRFNAAGASGTYHEKEFCTL